MDLTSNPRVLRIPQAIAIFAVSTAYFLVLLFTMLPLVKSLFSMNPAVCWFITGYFLFIPLFLFAVLAARNEGNTSSSQIAAALSVHSMSHRDWTYAVVFTLLSFLCTGLIFGLSSLLKMYFGISELRAEPWFMHMQPFEGREKLLLLAWLPMFAFNIAGEELLWRGYVQSRLVGRNSWIICTFLWLLFHLPFGFDLMVILFPFMLFVTYAFHKTRNTAVTMFIHAIYNGPIFIFIALGVVK